MGSFERKLRPERRAIASNRSETPTESLADSLLPVLSNSSSRLEADVWREAFCRDVEAFSHVLLLDQNVRPQGCPKINSSLCAVLYDRLSFQAIQCGLARSYHSNLSCFDDFLLYPC